MASKIREPKTVQNKSECFKVLTRNNLFNPAPFVRVQDRNATLDVDLSIVIGRASQRARISEADAVQKLPGGSVESHCPRRAECSCIKSSTKASRLTIGFSDLISEELIPLACPPGVDERRRLL